MNWNVEFTHKCNWFWCFISNWLEVFTVYINNILIYCLWCCLNRCVFEDWQVCFWNGFGWNVSNWSNVECVDGSLSCWDKWLFNINVNWSFMNWQVCNSVKCDWFNCSVVNWNEIISIDCNNSGDLSSRINWCDFVSEDSCVKLWNNWKWNISLISYFECVNWTFIFIYNCFTSVDMLWSWINWNIFYSLNCQWLYLLTSNWNIISSIHLENWSCSFLDWCHFIVKDRSVNFWNNNERNVSFVSDFECVYFFVCNNRSSNINRWAGFFDWNVSNSF